MDIDSLLFSDQTSQIHVNHISAFLPKNSVE